ncbi:MAG: hypothetical protein JXN61_14630, partial [Sedimentisphaerales bacterium]|nr:hypothetical protein [Sedimentisphaerales bacterium]
MCKARFSIYAAMVLLLAFTADSYSGYSGGTGEPNSPFEIATVADWQELMDTPADWGKHFILTADLDMNGIEMSPVGNDPNNFTGAFDGNDRIIRNVDINTPEEDYVGLFGRLGPGTRLRNTGLENASIAG